MRRSPNIIYVGDTVDGEPVTDVVAYYLRASPLPTGPQVPVDCVDPGLGDETRDPI